MPDSCEHEFKDGQKVWLVCNHDSDLSGTLFVVINLRQDTWGNKPTYNCRLLKTSTRYLHVGETYTLMSYEMQEYCMFGATMSDHLDIGGKDVNS